MNRFVEAREAIVVFRDERTGLWRLVIRGVLLHMTFATEAEARAHKLNINDSEQPLT